MECRINKYLSQIGYCSRREADRLIEDGRVYVDGVAATAGLKVLGTEEIIVDGKVVDASISEPIVLAFNKPKGLVCSTVSSKHEGMSVVEYIDYPERIYPVGRLDKDSTGLLLLTNQGDLANDLMKARNFHEKEYEVIVDKSITSDFIKKMSGGVEILDTVTRPCVVKKTSDKQFSIILTQGLNRQIRRMCEALGYRVRSLHRIRIVNVTLGKLAVGKFRQLSKSEIEALKKSIYNG